MNHDPIPFVLASAWRPGGKRMATDSQVEIAFREIEHSDAVEARVREKVAELEQWAPQLTRCRVTISAPHQRHRKGTLYSVRVDLRMSNAELAVSRQHRYDHAHEVYTWRFATRLQPSGASSKTTCVGSATR